jgi:hypothetical protein
MKANDDIDNSHHVPSSYRKCTVFFVVKTHIRPAEKRPALKKESKVVPVLKEVPRHEDVTTA